MNFIKQNLFLVIVIGAVVVLGGAMIGLNMLSLSDSVTAEIAKRESLSKSLMLFKTGAGINAALVDAQKNHVNTVRDAAKEVANDQTQKDKAAHPVLKLEIKQEGGTIRETVDAFPYDTKKYIESGLTLVFINEHRAATNKIMDQLKITYLPTKDDIDAEKRNIEARRPRGGTETVDPNRFYDQAALVRTVASAAKGYLYCDDNSIVPQITFGPKEMAADDIILWKKQFKLWVLQDLVSAIKATNDEVMAKLDPSQRNVTTAAVKHLLSLSIEDNYFVHAVTPASPPVSPTLRVTCKDYDVLNYSFTVVMPTRYIQALQQKLMANRYHTVLQIKMEDLPHRKELSDYYYGTDPIMIVTFTNEFLMLTSWERNLMPASFLQTLPDSVKREGDVARGKTPAIKPS